MSAFLTPAPTGVRPNSALSARVSRVKPRPRPTAPPPPLPPPPPPPPPPPRPRATLAAPSSPSAAPSQPERGVVHAVATPEQFDALQQYATLSDSLLVVDFLAAWCRKCTNLLPRFRKLARQYPHALFVSVDVNAVARLPRQFDVRAMPTFVFLRNGQRVDTLVGGAAPPIVAERLQRLLQTHAATEN